MPTIRIITLILPSETFYDRSMSHLFSFSFASHYREENGAPISIFFDMADTGLSNMDMEFTKYLIGLFKTYYPNYLNYIIIYEMPWVLNAAFKIIKTWLPAKAIQKIKFVNKVTLKDYVDPDNALVSWGGNDNFTFTFVPETQAAAGLTNGKFENKKVSGRRF